MGNISEAFGRVTISAPTFQDIEVLVATHRVITEKPGHQRCYKIPQVK